MMAGMISMIGRSAKREELSSLQGAGKKGGRKRLGSGDNLGIFL